MRTARSRRALLRRVKVWAAATGCPIRWRGRFVSRWDGTALCLAAELPGLQARVEAIVHEVNHWIAAPPARRLLPNYGLGPGVDDDGPKLTSVRLRETEERAVTALDVDVMLRLGFPRPDIVRWAAEVLHTTVDVRRARRSLAAKGFTISDAAAELLDHVVAR